MAPPTAPLLKIVCQASRGRRSGGLDEKGNPVVPVRRGAQPGKKNSPQQQTKTRLDLTARTAAATTAALPAALDRSAAKSR